MEKDKLEVKKRKGRVRPNLKKLKSSTDEQSDGTKQKSAFQVFKENEKQSHKKSDTFPLEKSSDKKNDGNSIDKDKKKKSRSKARKKEIIDFSNKPIEVDAVSSQQFKVSSTVYIPKNKEEINEMNIEFLSKQLDTESSLIPSTELIKTPIFSIQKNISTPTSSASLSTESLAVDLGVRHAIKLKDVLSDIADLSLDFSDDNDLEEILLNSGLVNNHSDTHGANEDTKKKRKSRKSVKRSERAKMRAEKYQSRNEEADKEYDCRSTESNGLDSTKLPKSDNREFTEANDSKANSASLSEEHQNSRKSDKSQKKKSHVNTKRYQRKLDNFQKQSIEYEY